MKSPDDIKKGLEKEIPVHYHLPNPEPRLHPTELIELESLHASALAYINKLEQRLAQLERERDAAVEDLREADMVDCCHCKHYKVYGANECDAEDCTCDDCKRDCPCKNCKTNSNWEWRGVQE